ncbi:hypothetical protein ACFL09_05725 [Planctomycetota bacterium]
MRPKSLVWLVCTSVAVLFAGLLLAVSGGARQGVAAAEAAYDVHVGGDPTEVGYLGSSVYDRDAIPFKAEPVVRTTPARPAGWVGALCGLGMLGLFIFLGVLALRGTADNVVRIRNAAD